MFLSWKYAVFLLEKIEKGIAFYIGADPLSRAKLIFFQIFLEETTPCLSLQAEENFLDLKREEVKNILFSIDIRLMWDSNLHTT